MNLDVEMPAVGINRALCYTQFSSPFKSIDLRVLRSVSQVAALSIRFSGAQIFGEFRFKLDERIIRIVVAVEILIEKEAVLRSVCLEHCIIYNLYTPAEPDVAGVAVFRERDIDFNESVVFDLRNLRIIAEGSKEIFPFVKEEHDRAHTRLFAITSCEIDILILSNPGQYLLLQS